MDKAFINKFENYITQKLDLYGNSSLERFPNSWLDLISKNAIILEFILRIPLSATGLPAKAISLSVF